MILSGEYILEFEYGCIDFEGSMGSEYAADDLEYFVSHHHFFGEVFSGFFGCFWFSLHVSREEFGGEFLSCFGRLGWRVGERWKWKCWCWW